MRGEGYGTALGRFIAEDGTSLPLIVDLEKQIREEPSHPATTSRAELLRAIRENNLPSGRIEVVHGWKHASILASEVDMTLLVVQYRKYPQAMTLRAKQMIDKVGGNLIGVVLNNINMAHDSYYYYYSGFYSNYYAPHEQLEERATKNDHQREERSQRQEGDAKPNWPQPAEFSEDAKVCSVEFLMKFGDKIGYTLAQGQ